MNSPLLLSPQEFSDLIAAAREMDVNHDGLYVYNVFINNVNYYMLELVWATNEVNLYQTPDTKPLTGIYQLSVQPTT